MLASALIDPTIVSGVIVIVIGAGVTAFVSAVIRISKEVTATAASLAVVTERLRMLEDHEDRIRVLEHAGMLRLHSALADHRQDQREDRLDERQELRQELRQDRLDQRDAAG